MLSLGAEGGGEGGERGREDDGDGSVSAAGDEQIVSSAGRELALVKRAGNALSSVVFGA